MRGLTALRAHRWAYSPNRSALIWKRKLMMQPSATRTLEPNSELGLIAS